MQIKTVALYGTLGLGLFWLFKKLQAPVPERLTSRGVRLIVTTPDGREVPVEMRPQGEEGLTAQVHTGSYPQTDLHFSLDWAVQAGKEPISDQAPSRPYRSLQVLLGLLPWLVAKGNPVSLRPGQTNHFVVEAVREKVPTGKYTVSARLDGEDESSRMTYTATLLVVP